MLLVKNTQFQNLNCVPFINKLDSDSNFFVIFVQNCIIFFWYGQNLHFPFFKFLNFRFIITLKVKFCVLFISNFESNFSSFGLTFCWELFCELLYHSFSLHINYCKRFFDAMFSQKSDQLDTYVKFCKNLN